MDLTTKLIIIAVVFVIFSLFAMSYSKKEDEDITEKIAKALKDKMFISSQVYISQGVMARSGISINEDENKIALLEYNNLNRVLSRAEIFSYKDIIGVEIKHDGVVVTQTKRSSQILGGAVGGILLGPAGMLIGGLSGKTVQKDNQDIKNVQLLIYVNSIEKPVQEIEFYRLNSWETLEEALKNVNKWEKIIEILIKRADRDVAKENVIIPTSTPANNSSMVSELTNLVELKKSGAITNDEYETLKQQIMNIANK